MNIKVKVGSNYPIMYTKEQMKQETEKLLKIKDEEIKSLQLQTNKLELQIALIQDLNGYA